jgi:hypothetical protein
MLFVGAATNHDWLIYSSLLVGPLAGVALPQAWLRARRPRPGMASRYQAVYVSGLEIDFGGQPTGFTMTFENPAYASRFVALNRDAGVVGA